MKRLIWWFRHCNHMFHPACPFCFREAVRRYEDGRDAR